MACRVGGRTGLAGNAETDIQERIATSCDIPVESIYLCRLERMRLRLKHFPEVPKEADLDLVGSPLIVSPDDLAEVAQALVRQKDTVIRTVN